MKIKCQSYALFQAYRKNGTRDPRPSTSDPSLGTRNPRPIGGIRDPGPYVGPYTWDPLPEILYVGDLGQRKKSHFVYLPQVGFI